MFQKTSTSVGNQKSGNTFRIYNNGDKTMKIVITESWAKATGRGADKASRTFEVLNTDHSLIGCKGFDTFYKVNDGGYAWTVASARVEETINSEVEEA